MKKRIAFFLCSMVLAAFAAASPVDPGRARRVAVGFMQGMGMAKADLLVDLTAQTPYREFYVFALEEGGFVLVSGDDRALPVLGYSLSSPFVPEAMPEHVESWLAGYDAELRLVRERCREVPADVLRQWELLDEGELPSPVLTATAPLLNTTWSQSPYYNNLCPYDNSYGQRTVTGCVATATAQIMKFWEHPTKGYSSHSYRASNDHTSYGRLSANFGNTTYQWSRMPASLSSSSPSSAVSAVATLMYHVGVADEMVYDVSANGGSGAQNYQYTGSISPSSQHSLVAYFKYRGDMAAVSRDDYPDATYCAMLRAELDQRRPILYSGRSVDGGHSFVLDGYDNAGKFHVNWGWGGYFDGYFVMGSLNPGVGGIGGNASGTYNMRNVALLGIQPSTGWSSSSRTTVSATTQGGTSACRVTGTGSIRFGSTVSLAARAATGYRFDGWSDGSKFNPREFVATGGSYNFTALFAPVGDDTLSYCPGGYVNRWGGSTDVYWGVKFPYAVRDINKGLAAVQLFVAEPGTYEMKIYTGRNRSTTAYTATVAYTSSDVGCWRTIRLNTPVVSTSDIWITFHTNGIDYPAAYTYGAGVEGAFLYESSFTDYSLDEGVTAMIKGIFRSVVQPNASVDANCVISEFPYTMNFEAGMPCWTVGDTNADGETWDLMSEKGYGESRCAGISYASHADDWLSSPSITGAGRYMVDWRARVRHFSYPETYQLWAEGRNGSTLLFEETLTESSLFADRQAEFRVAAGDTVRLRFRYISDEQYELYLDDVVIDRICRQYSVAGLSSDPTQGAVTGSGIYDSAAHATLTAVPARHYRFLRWTDGQTDNPRQVLVACDTTLTACFEPAPIVYHTVTVATADSSQGSVAGGGTFEEGDTVAIEALPMPGFRFLFWDDGDGSNPRQVVVERDTLYTAHFGPVPIPTFVLSVLSADTLMGLANGGGVYDSGSVALLSVTPADGYRFSHWNDGDTSSSRSIVVTADTSLTAFFVAEQVGIVQPSRQAVAVWPNPAQHQVAVSWPHRGMAAVALISAGGVLLHEQWTESCRLLLDVSGYARGVYFLRIAFEGEVHTVKLVLE